MRALRALSVLGVLVWVLALPTGVGAAAQSWQFALFGLTQAANSQAELASLIEASEKACGTESHKAPQSAPGRIRTADHLVRSRKDDFIGSYFSTT